ncbi:hypothetical protein LINGRAHAP2_LOCUS31457, partial [Linum grandiflorum]
TATSPSSPPPFQLNSQTLPPAPHLPPNTQHPKLHNHTYPPPYTSSYLHENFNTTPELLKSSSPSPILPKMSPRPRSSNYKMIAFKTPGAAARWREMMSARAASQTPESSRAASPP